MLDALIRAAMEEFAQRAGFPARLKNIPVYVWIVLNRTGS